MSTLPLHLYQVLEDEYAALHGASGYTPRSRELQDGDLHDAERFRARLEAATDPLGIFLKTKLNGNIRLIEALNHALEDRRDPLYTAERFRRVTLGRDLTTLIALTIDDDEEFTYVNRRLLESAFPDEIRAIDALRLAAVFAAIHARANRDDGGRGHELRTALCLSGGGIRSATFGLGVIQGLARLGLLDKFHYLSTVSGGGYIGSWLSGWAHRRRDGLAGVASELEATSPRHPLEREPGPIRNLRRYTNYLSPRLALMSADTWTLVGIYLRNLVLNWLVLVPLLIAAVMVPRVATALLQWRPEAFIRVPCLIAGLALLIWSVAYVGLYRPGLEEFRRGRSLTEPNQGHFLRHCLLPLLLAAMFLVAYWTWLNNAVSTASAGSASWVPPSVVRVFDGWRGFVVTGTVLHFVAWLGYSSRLRRFDGQELPVVMGTGALGGYLVWLAAAHVLPVPTVSQTTTILAYVTVSVPLFLVMFLLAATLFVGLSSRWTDDEAREWWARFGAWVLVASVSWAVVSTLVIFMPYWLKDQTPHVRALIASLGGLSGIAAALAGRSPRTSGKDSLPAPGVGALLMRHGITLITVIGVAALIVGLSIATNGLLVLAKIALTPWMPDLVIGLPDRFTDHLEILQETRVDLSGMVTALMALIAWLMGYGINVNKFSLHAMYRDRLIRAYLGASREHRDPNPFTGFDPDDNIQMHELRGEAFDESSFTDLHGFVKRLKEAADAPSRALLEWLPRTREAIATDQGPAPSRQVRESLFDELNELLESPKIITCEALGGNTEEKLHGVPRVRRGRELLEAGFPQEIAKTSVRTPLHVVNIALNLVAGHDLAWQERKAESFTVTPWHAGSYQLGYRNTREYGGSRPGRQGISLGTAVAISGAAASPNMGYHSSPLLAFLMTLFNVRLGWWLGNPGPKGQGTFRRPFPMPSIRPIVDEAFALTDDTNPWVYLSDGGHFDNLGLLEMVLRRCHLIVVSDAGCDPTCAFGDLGNAIRKVRADLGVTITIDHELHICSRDNAEGRKQGTYAALATIDYRTVDGPQAVLGRLVYVKPSVYWITEPVDVQNYARTSATFPHEMTADQFFSESQFESYRALGLHEIHHLWTIRWPGQWPTTMVTLADFLAHVEHYLAPREGARYEG